VRERKCSEREVVQWERSSAMREKYVMQLES
jgi:hypothetical protein